MISANTSIRNIPVKKVSDFNYALPSANTDIISPGITSTFGTTSNLTIYVCISIAGVVKVTRTISSTTITEILNSGNSLVAGAAYMFTVPIYPGNTVNVQYSSTGGTIYILQIDESSEG